VNAVKQQSNAEQTWRSFASLRERWEVFVDNCICSSKRLILLCDAGDKAECCFVNCQRRTKAHGACCLKHPTHRDVDSVLQEIRDLRDCKKIVDVATLLRALTGARRGTRWVPLVLAEITHHVLSAHHAHVDEKDMSVCMMSLKHVSSNDAEVRALLSALVPTFVRITNVSARFVGMALNGLRGCSSGHAEVRSVLEVLAPQIAKCSETLSEQELGMALDGLRGCSSEHAEVRSVLKALAPHIANALRRFSAQGVAMALGGLRGCSSEHAEVRSVLAALAPQIAKCSEASQCTGSRHGFGRSQRLQQRARRGAIRPQSPCTAHREML